MLCINVFFVGIKENNVISTNPFVVDAMLPTMTKHANIWTLELVSIQALHLYPEKKSKAKTTTAIKDHILFCDHTVSLEDFKILVSSNSEFHVKIKEILLISLYKTE